jgi:hypothetical protein
MKDALPMFRKIQLKHGFEENGIRNNFPYWYFPKFRIEYELKIKESLGIEIRYNLMEIDWNFQELIKFESEAPGRIWKTQLMTRNLEIQNYDFIDLLLEFDLNFDFGYCELD